MDKRPYSRRYWHEDESCKKYWGGCVAPLLHLTPMGSSRRGIEAGDSGGTPIDFGCRVTVIFVSRVAVNASEAG